MVSWLVMWAILVSAALAFRPLMPVDETRYLAVAWEMWLRDDFLVPHLNGAPYSHKPPLLFWLMQAGWSVFGVNEWWPRLVAPLFGLASLYLISAICRRLWPEDLAAPAAAPMILLGSLFWALYTTLTMFDMLVAALALLGLLGVLAVWRRGGIAGWILLAVATGLGALAKGPVILLFTLPTALLAPWWDTERRIAAAPGGWLRWYLGLAAAITLGAAMALAWALPAAERGGEAYSNAILWGQTAGRMVNSFAHKQPFWWHLALLPALCLPWALLPSFWWQARALRHRRSEQTILPTDPGSRFCLIWFVVALVVLSLVSGKQPHYLLPALPALACLAARWLSSSIGSIDRADAMTVAGAALVLALAMAGFGSGGELRAAGVDRFPVNALWAVPLAAGAVFVAWRQPPGLMPVTALSALIIISVHGYGKPGLQSTFDVHPIARYLGDIQQAGRPVAHDGKYHGQYNFPGRLTQPLSFVDCKTAPDWLRQHPNAALVYYTRRPPTGVKADVAQRVRGKYAGVWDAATVLADPGNFDCEPR